ncbi:MAG: hypothetical protein EHM83_12715, partial [Burkholderiales bacterium]
MGEIIPVDAAKAKSGPAGGPGDARAARAAGAVRSACIAAAQRRGLCNNVPPFRSEPPMPRTFPRRATTLPGRCPAAIGRSARHLLQRAAGALALAAAVAGCSAPQGPLAGAPPQAPLPPEALVADVLMIG